MRTNLVGGFNHLEKYESHWKYWKSMGRIIPYIMENKKCLKPPTSNSPNWRNKSDSTVCKITPITYKYILPNKKICQRLDASNLCEIRVKNSCAEWPQFLSCNDRIYYCHLVKESQPVSDCMSFWDLPSFHIRLIFNTSINWDFRKINRSTTKPGFQGPLMYMMYITFHQWPFGLPSF